MQEVEFEQHDQAKNEVDYLERLADEHGLSKEERRLFTQDLSDLTGYNIS